MMVNWQILMLYSGDQKSNSWNSCINTKKQLEKKIAKYEEALKTAQKDMGSQKMKSTFFVGLIFIALFAVLNSS